ncbi:hypothetical protein [Streptomyces sp. NPDC047079]
MTVGDPAHGSLPPYGVRDHPERYERESHQERSLDLEEARLSDS